MHEYTPDVKYYGLFVKHLLVGGDLTINDINKIVDVRSQSQTNTVGVNGYISIPVDVRSQSTGRV